MFARYPKISNGILQKLDRYDLGILSSVILYTFIFSYITLVELSLFQLGRDVAIFNQAFWTTIHSGGLLVNSFEGVSHFGYHFSPMLLSILPLYLIAPGPQLLLITQSALLGLGAIPIYICGSELLGKKAGFIIGILYLLYPAVHGANLFAFHELAFLPLFLGTALLGFITGKKNLFFISCIICLLIKEDVALIIGMIGLVGIIRARLNQKKVDWRHIVLVLLSALILIIYIFIMKPAFGLADTSDSVLFISQYSDPYANVNGDVNQRFVFLGQIFLPLAFSPLFSPELFIISIPSLIEILFSSPDVFVYYNIFSHYPLLITPIFFMATILSLLKVKQCNFPKIQKLFYPLLILLLISSSASVIMYSPINSLENILSFDPSEQYIKDQKTLNELSSIIPASASVSTQWQLLTLMSERYSVWEGYHPNADVILIFPYYNGANIFSDYKKEIVSNYDQIDIGKSFYLFVRKGQTGLQKDIKDRLINAGIAVNSS